MSQFENKEIEQNNQQNSNNNTEETEKANEQLINGDSINKNQELNDAEKEKLKLEREEEDRRNPKLKALDLNHEEVSYIISNMQYIIH